MTVQITKKNVWRDVVQSIIPLPRLSRWSKAMMSAISFASIGVNMLVASSVPKQSKENLKCNVFVSRVKLGPLKKIFYP